MRRHHYTARVRFLIHGRDAEYPSLIDKVLGIARQSYYCCRTVVKAEHERARRVNALSDAHRDDVEFGYRFPGRDVRAAEPARVAAALGRPEGRVGTALHNACQPLH